MEIKIVNNVMRMVIQRAEEKDLIRTLAEPKYSGCLNTNALKINRIGYEN